VVAILDKILRAGEGRALKQLEKIADEVNSHESTFAAMSDEELRSMTDLAEKILMTFFRKHSQ
jgi:preprotein translocase subunit SecA